MTSNGVHTRGQREQAQAQTLNTAGAAVLLAAALLAGASVAAGGSQNEGLVVSAMFAVVAALVVMVIPRFAAPLAVYILWTNAPVVAANSHGAPVLVALVVPVLLIIPVASRMIAGQKDIFVNSGFVWMMAILGAGVASTVVGGPDSRAVPDLVQFIQEGLITYLLVINAIRSPGAARDAAWAIIAAGASLALLSVTQSLLGRADQPFGGFALLDSAYLQGLSTGARSQGPVGDANYYAQLLLPAVALGLAFARYETTRRLRVVAGLTSALIALAIAFTYSRGATVALILMAIAMGAMGYMRMRQFVIIILCAAALVLVVPGYGDRISSLARLGGVTEEAGSAGAADDSAQLRATENKAALLVFQDHVLLGVGPGNYPLYYQEYARRAGGAVHLPSKHGRGGTAAGAAPQREAHSMLLNIAADRGIAGLASFAGLLLFTFGSLIRARRRWRGRRPEYEMLATGFIVATAGYLIAGTFLTLAYERYFWLLLALSAAAAAALLGPAASDPEDMPPRAPVDRLGARSPRRDDDAPAVAMDPGAVAATAAHSRPP